LPQRCLAGRADAARDQVASKIAYVGLVIVGKGIGSTCTTGKKTWRGSISEIYRRVETDRTVNLVFARGLLEKINVAASDRHSLRGAGYRHGIAIHVADINIRGTRETSFDLAAIWAKVWPNIHPSGPSSWVKVLST
jgi:hypothetical protein